MLMNSCHWIHILSRFAAKFKELILNHLKSIMSSHCIKNCLEPVYGKYMCYRSQLISKVNNSSQISQAKGVIHWGERGMGRMLM